MLPLLKESIDILMALGFRMPACNAILPLPMRLASRYNTKTLVKTAREYLLTIQHDLRYTKIGKVNRANTTCK